MRDTALLTEALRAAGVPHRLSEPLAKHTTIQIGGEALVYCTPRSVTQLAAALSLVRKHEFPLYILGKGSNTVFDDALFDGVVVEVGEALGAVSVNDTLVTAEAGAALSRVCLEAGERGLSGLEFAYGIPGSVGGAVFMNAGAYGGEIKDVLVRVDYLDEEGILRTIGADQMQLGYRSSVFMQEGWCILRAVFRLGHAEPGAVRARMDELMQRRVDKQPLDTPSAGSTFKRPQGAYAGALIEQCGLRGLRVGGAAVSEKHCGFVVNLGGATCRDFLELTGCIRATVLEKTGYELSREIRIVRSAPLDEGETP